jgi:ABC-type nitrate/sulfonate/bicarbonate transport system permease component
MNRSVGHGGHSRLQHWLPLLITLLATIAPYLLTLDDTAAFIVAPPSVVAQQLLTTLPKHSDATLSKIGLGFALDVSSAFLLDDDIAPGRLFEQAFGPYAVEFQGLLISTIALVLSRFFGPGIAAKGIIGALIIFLPKRVSMMVGTRTGDRDLRYTLRILVGIIPQTARAAISGLEHNGPEIIASALSQFFLTNPVEQGVTAHTGWW